VAEAVEPGGWARRSSTLSGRQRLGLAAVWLEAECRRLGVKVLEGHAVTPDEAAGHEGPVVVATGGRDRPPTFEVAEGARLVSAAGLVSGLDDLPHGPVVVWDPLGGPVAVAVAEELAAKGRVVVLVTPDVVVGTQLSLTGDLAPANVRLHQAGVELVKRAVLRRVEKDRVVLEDRFAGTLLEREAGWVIDCGHRLPDDTPWPQDAVRIGDAVAPRTIHEAILEGRRAAIALLARRTTAFLQPGPVLEVGR
jgi:hypothetical protein